MQAGEAVIGIDISKASFDSVMRGAGKEQHQVFSNDQKGYEKIVAWIRKQPERVVHVGMEATGRYWVRSEERRVGKECRSRWSPYH